MKNIIPIITPTKSFIKNERINGSKINIELYDLDNKTINKENIKEII